MIHTNAKRCSAVGATAGEAIGDEPLPVPRAVVRDRGHVLGPVLAPVRVASVTAVSDFVSEAAGGCEGHHLVVRHANSAVGVRFMKSSQLFIKIRHDIGIVEGFFKRV